MTRMNYDRQAKRDRVRSDEAKARAAQRIRPFQWAPLPFKKHRGKTWPEVLFADLPFFVWAGQSLELYGPIARQYRMVSDRCSHILPDQEYLDDYDFAHFLNSDGSYREFLIVFRGDPFPEIDDGVHYIGRTTHLDMLAALMARNKQASAAAMINCVRREFFSEIGNRPNSEELFFMDDCNFDLTCREPHR